jgi:hypothetical protein
MTVHIALPRDRFRAGTIRATFQPEGGEPAREKVDLGACLGKSDNTRARAAGNPSRDPRNPFGDFPLGTYRGVVSSELWYPLRSYGAEPPVMLSPVSGDALEAYRNGRRGLAIHSGDLRKGRLRVTHGCLRVTPGAHAELVSLARECTAIVVEAIESIGGTT